MVTAYLISGRVVTPLVIPILNHALRTMGLSAGVR